MCTARVYDSLLFFILTDNCGLTKGSCLEYKVPWEGIGILKSLTMQLTTFRSATLLCFLEEKDTQQWKEIYSTVQYWQQTFKTDT